MPFRHIAKAATPKLGGARYRLTKVFEELSEILPGSAGKWCERRAHKLAVKNFQGHYDVAVGYLIAHEELVEEEMESPSSFALNTIINQCARWS